MKTYEIVDGLEVVTDVELIDIQSAFELVGKAIADKRREKRRHQIVHRRKVKTLIATRAQHILLGIALLIIPVLVSAVLYPDCTALLLYLVFGPLSISIGTER